MENDIIKNENKIEEEDMEKRERKLSLDSRIDYSLILPVFILMIIGMLSLYVALSHDTQSTDAMRSLMFQGLWYVIGIIAIVVIIQFDSKALWKITPYLYAIGLIIMALLVKFYDRQLAAKTGSRNWFSFGGFTFQPSEIMKIAFILMLAYVITKHNDMYTVRTVKSDLWLIAKMLFVFAPVAILIKLQQDFGTLLVFVAILGGCFLLSGIEWKIELPIIITFVVVAALGIYLVTTESGRKILGHLGFQSYQFKRIDAWLHPFEDASNSTYQQAQGLLAIGSGGLFGKGFNHTDVYVPVRESDMIFTVIAENFGFIGGAFVILMYLILIYRMISICFETKNPFYAYIATGIIMMLLFHVFENIGSNIGLLPLTGIPLPFISQGGSAIISNMIGIGLMMSMTFQKQSNRKARGIRS